MNFCEYYFSSLLRFSIIYINSSIVIGYMIENFSISMENVMFIVYGLAATLKYSFTAIFFGTILGFFLAICKVLDNKIAKNAAYIYSSVFRGTPVLIQLSIIHFVFLPTVFGANHSVFLSGAIAFSLNSAAYVSEIVRSGINSIDYGQIEAAKALGVSATLRMKDIILPQAIKKILPSLVNEFINLIKESAVVSVIGGMDMMQRANIVAASMFSYFEPLLVASLSYYIIVMLVSVAGSMLEKKLAS